MLRAAAYRARTIVLRAAAFRGRTLVLRAAAFRARTIVLRAAILLSLAALTACAVAPQSREGMASYDFGPLRPDKEANPRLQHDIVVAGVSAPAWMDNSGIYYRLAYRDASRPQAYARSRWVMPPAALLGQRLRASIARANQAGVFSPADGVRAEYALRLELEEFTQVFDAVDKSHAVVLLRASLIRHRGVVVQRGFSVERAAATANAEGGVQALIAASDEAGHSLLDWLAANMKK